MSDAAALELTGLTKRFAGTLALDGVDFDVQPGEVHALLGENGAGKSTLIKVLAGLYPADRGNIRLLGLEVDPLAERLPIAFIHQDLGLALTLSVAENIALVAGYPRRRGLIDWPRLQRRAAEVLTRMNADIAPERQVIRLSAAERAIVAIARAVFLDRRLIVLDEPTASLAERDVARLFEVIDAVRAEGAGIVYVTHRLDEVFRIGDRVTVLRDGRKIETERVADTSPERLVDQIAGRRLTQVRGGPAITGPAVLEVDRLAVRGAGPLSFTLHRGEILGLVGLRGAGQEVVGRALFGLLQRTGSVRVAGRPLKSYSVAEAIARGIGFVSSNRGEEGIASSLTVRENLLLNPLHSGSRLFGYSSHRREARECAGRLQRFAIRPADPERVVDTLSGGNQQKVILARWLETSCDVLVLEEPTTGVDVGARAEIYELLRAASGAGRSVLLIESDFKEVVSVCSRAIVLHRGMIVKELAGDDLSVERLTSLASGAALTEAAYR